MANPRADPLTSMIPDGQAVYFAGPGHVGVWPEAPEESVARALPFLRRALKRFIASLRR